MKPHFPFLFLFFALLVACTKKNGEGPSSIGAPTELEPLFSWQEGDSKKAILEFVRQAVDTASPGFVPLSKRIAVFDNDGTLWGEQPFYFQLAYALDFVRQEAPKHPEWSKDPVLKAAVEGDTKAVMAGGEKALIHIVMKSHAGMTEGQFDEAVRNWLTSSKHPDTGKPYTQMIYQPMLELLDFLRSNGFKTFIVSGGGIDFLRVWAEEVYGIPPYQIVGSSVKATYTEHQGEKAIVKLPELNFINDGPGKPVGIHQHIGTKPVIAVGNSDGDFEMLEYTTQGAGARLGILIHHTDSVREYAYDSLSHIGNLKRGLIEGPERGWIIIDMAKDWKTIYPN